MKVLFDHPSPFLLAHGGHQTQIESTLAGLKSNGVDVDYLRWWDDAQKPDLIHYFGVPSLAYIEMAKAKGIKVVITHLLTATCNRPAWKLRLQGKIIRLLLKVPGWGIIKNQLTWQSLQKVDHLMVGLEVERQALIKAFNVPAHKISKVPLGLSSDYLQVAPRANITGEYIITTGTITERKRSLELARMAKEARVPILFVGKPYSEKDPYWREFQQLIDGEIVRYEGHVSSPDRLIELLQSARGFVIYSQFENWCLSAHEAVACGLPILVQDQPWSREVFGGKASYLSNTNSRINSQIIARFFQEASTQAAPPCSLVNWSEVGKQIVKVYEQVLRTS